MMGLRTVWTLGILHVGPGFVMRMQHMVFAAFALIVTSTHAADYPQQAINAKTRNEVLQALFGTDQVEPSQDVQILHTIPELLEFRVALHKPERIAVLATRDLSNPFPYGFLPWPGETAVVAVFDLTPTIRPYINLRLTLPVRTRLDVVVLAQGRLHGSFRDDRSLLAPPFIDWASGPEDRPYCTTVKELQTPMRTLANERLPNVIQARSVHGGGITKLDLGFSHPMNNGSRFYPSNCTRLPKYMIEAIRIEHGSKRIGDIWPGPGMDRNTTLGMMLDGPTPGQEISFNWRDTSGAGYKATHTISLHDLKNYSALAHAALTNDPEWGRRALAQGAEVDHRDSETSKTPLLLAASMGSTEVARLLLDHGADIEARFTYGQTPLFSAADAGHLDLLQLLIARGANPNILSKGYMSIPADTPLTRVVRNLWSAYYGRPVKPKVERLRVDIVRTLIAAGADINARAGDRKSPLMLAREGEMVEIEQLLLQAGARMQ